MRVKLKSIAFIWDLCRIKIAKIFKAAEKGQRVQ